MTKKYIEPAACGPMGHLAHYGKNNASQVYSVCAFSELALRR